MEISIDILREMCNNKAIKWTNHVQARLEERDIYPSDVINCIQTGEIIEQYPEDYPYPSCLMLGCSVDSDPLHVVVGVGGGMIWLVTAYRPDLIKWEPDYKTRREPTA